MFKFQSEFNDIFLRGAQCPPAEAVEMSREGWRWVFSPMGDKCFTPQAKRNPRRLLRATNPSEECDCWGLSMHDTEGESVAAFQFVEESFTQARFLLGSHIAFGVVDKTHGLCSPSDSRGHFNLYQYSSAKFYGVGGAFKIVKVIPCAT